MALRPRKHSHSQKQKKKCSGSLVCCQQKMRRYYCVQFFFQMEKNFCLLGREEHRQLQLSQLKKFTDPLGYTFTENTSKIHSGGLAQMSVKNKAVLIIAVPEAGTRCHVHVT